MLVSSLAHGLSWWLIHPFREVGNGSAIAIRAKSHLQRKAATGLTVVASVAAANGRSLALFTRANGMFSTTHYLGISSNDLTGSDTVCERERHQFEGEFLVFRFRFRFFQLLVFFFHFQFFRLCIIYVFIKACQS